MDGRRSRRIASIACGLLLVTTACVELGARVERTAQTPSPLPTRSNQPVLVVGDSLTVGAMNAGGLAGKLTARGWIPEIVAEAARTTPWATEQVVSRTEVPRVVLVAMGTNPSPILRDFPAEIDALVRALRERGARTIVWVPPVHAEPGRYAERVAALQRRADDGSIILTDWPAEIGAHPEWFHTDGIHLTPDGYAARADHMRAALDRV